MLAIPTTRGSRFSAISGAEAAAVRCLAALVWIAWFSVQPAMAGVMDTKHNLSASGPGTVRAEKEGRVCIFCHTPHMGGMTEGLWWNRSDSTATYIPYDSPTMHAKVGQPTGSSKLCLSCHDGTVALGKVLSEKREIGMVGGVRFMPKGAARLGTDLSDDHPVSFDYDDILVKENTELVDPSTLVDEVRLDPFGQLQCTSCHDPHDKGFGKFLVAPLERSALCLVCHDKKAWPSSAHAVSEAKWNGSEPDPWPDSDLDTVARNACANCHRSHSAPGNVWNLNYEVEEDNCLVCHNGQVAATDIESEIAALSYHPVELTSDIHNPDEDATLPLDDHVECTDCHNPHEATSDDSARAPYVKGALKGVSGLTAEGRMVERASFEYEICFKCHAQFSMTEPAISRQILENDKRLQFDPNGPSFHPVEAYGTNPNVPSLLPPYNETTIIYCTDCHSSDAGPGAGGSRPAGPHGSAYKFLLEREYNTLDEVDYKFTLYDLCYKCHSEQSILNDESFRGHRLHIVEENTPCSVCHDPHGISSSQGNFTNNSNLMNFDVSTVSPAVGSGVMDFEDLGDFKGRCYLLCHGEDHDPLEY